MTKREREKQERRTEAVKTLAQLGVAPGKRVYTSCSHVARSGMSRRIHVYIVTRDTETDREGKKRVEHRIHEITGLVAHALDYTRNQNDGGLVIGGCGMDMGFHVVYSLGRVMFPKGGSLKAASGVRQAQAERGGITREVDGGYLLKHEWL